MRDLTIALTFVAMPMVLAAQEQEPFPEAAVKNLCAEQFPGDFFMQSGCIDLQKEGWVALAKPIEGLPAGIQSEIKQLCKSHFPGDYFMQNGCLDLQSDAWKELNS